MGDARRQALVENDVLVAKALGLALDELCGIIRFPLDTTQPTGPIERTLTYQAPFTRCDREDDYRVAWEG